MKNLTIGKRIAELRKKAGLTQNELADKLIISNKAVSKWESDNGYPSLEMLIKLHDILKCSMDYLILGIDPTKPKEDGIFLNLGLDQYQKPYEKNLFKMIHTLIVGDVGSGKSILLHNLITQLISNYKNEVQLALIDCKKVEFDIYKNTPNLYSSIANDVNQAEKMLTDLVKLMENRYEMLMFHNCTKIQEYNKKFPHNKQPYIVVIIDELAELITFGNKTEKNDDEDYESFVERERKYSERTISENKIQRLTQLGRAAGIFVIVSSVMTNHKILTRTITNNLPTKIVFNLKESHKVPHYLSASFPNVMQKLGDFLFLAQDSNRVLQLHCPYISQDKIEKIIKNRSDN